MLDMGIIKVEVKLPELREAITGLDQSRKRFFELLSGEIKSAAVQAIEQLMHSEITLFLGKPSEKDNKRNGYEVREYAFKGLGGAESPSTRRS